VLAMRWTLPCAWLVLQLSLLLCGMHWHAQALADEPASIEAVHEGVHGEAKSDAGSVCWVHAAHAFADLVRPWSVVLPEAAQGEAFHLATLLVREPSLLIEHPPKARALF